MKLEGSLDAFSLPDVFQLLSLTKKSGGLHLTNGQVSGMVYFADGMVTGAVSDVARQALGPPTGRPRLPPMTPRSDVRSSGPSVTAPVSPEPWSRPVRWTSSLVQRLALEQAVDAVFDLLRWPNGDFAFGMGEENPDDVGLVVPAEQIVGEATTRRESWEALSRLIPSPDVVLTMPVVLPENTTLGRDEWALLALIDGIAIGRRPRRGLRCRAVHRRVHPGDADPARPARPSGRGEPRPCLAGHAPAAAAGTARGTGSCPPGSRPRRGRAGRCSRRPRSDSGPGRPGRDDPGDRRRPAQPRVPQAPVVPPAQPASVPAPAAAAAAPGLLPGAHDPAKVVPPRPEPFLPPREVDHPEPGRAPGLRTSRCRRRTAGSARVPRLELHRACQAGSPAAPPGE